MIFLQILIALALGGSIVALVGGGLWLVGVIGDDREIGAFTCGAGLLFLLVFLAIVTGGFDPVRADGCYHIVTVEGGKGGHTYTPIECP